MIVSAKTAAFFVLGIGCGVPTSAQPDSSDVMSPPSAPASTANPFYPTQNQLPTQLRSNPELRRRFEVEFEPNSEIALDGASKVLASVTAELKETPYVPWVIVRGLALRTESGAEALARRRAEVVRTRIVGSGADPECVLVPDFPTQIGIEEGAPRAEVEVQLRQCKPKP